MTKLTLEELALWLSSTHEPDLGRLSAERQAEMLASLSTNAPAKPGATRSQVQQGLIQGINERLSQMEWWSEDDRKKVNALLAERHLPDLRTMELVIKRKYRRIVKHASIANDEEYYLIKELLDGPSAAFLSAEEARTIWELRSAYENRART